MKFVCIEHDRIRRLHASNEASGERVREKVRKDWSGLDPDPNLKLD